jgi:ABC-type phosphate/phosphonate transport system permease subunit
MSVVGTAITAVILIWSIQGTKFNLWVLYDGMPNVLRFFKGMLPPWPMDFVTGQLIPPMVETIRIALAASMLGRDHVVIENVFLPSAARPSATFWAWCSAMPTS